MVIALLLVLGSSEMNMTADLSIAESWVGERVSGWEGALDTGYMGHPDLP